MRSRWFISRISLLLSLIFISVSDTVEGRSPSDGMALRADDLTAEQLAALKRHLLRSVGLTKRPARRRGLRPVVIPDYLWTIYRLMVNGVDDEDQYKDNEGGELWSLAGHRPLVDFNTVRTFFPQGMNSSVPQGTLRFDNLKVCEWERLVRVELRLPVNFSQLVRLHGGADQHMTRWRLNLYEVFNERLNIRSLIDTKTMILERSFKPQPSSLPNVSVQWVSFDVTSALTRRTSPSGSKMSHGPSFSVGLMSSSGHLADVSFRVDRQLMSMSDSTEMPMMLHYTTDLQKAVSHQKAVRTKRSPHRHRGSSTSGRKRHRHPGGGAATGRKNPRLNICQRHALAIRFEELNWQDWIVAPSGYNAYFCAGWCSYPLIDGQNTTNHAIVQSLINSVDPGAVPKPHCVPTDMSAVSMLYLDVDNRIVIKSYPDMVVEGCGCR